MTLNVLSDHSLPRFHFRLEACWTKASTPWQWCCSWQEPPTYQLGDLQRKIKLFWTLNFIALTHTQKKSKLKKLIPLKVRVFTNSKNPTYLYEIFYQGFHVVTVLSFLERKSYKCSFKFCITLWKKYYIYGALILPISQHSSHIINFAFLLYIFGIRVPSFLWS